MLFLSNCYFIGKEAEGFHRGISTLFVSKEEPELRDILALLRKFRAVKRIYFGAGSLYLKDYRVVDELLSADPQVSVVIECLSISPELAKLNDRHNKLLVILKVESIPYEIKTEKNEAVVSIRLDDKYATCISLEDNFFRDDKEVWA